MCEDKTLQQSRDALQAFNKLDEKIRDKILNGVKCLAFLQDLSDIEDDDGGGSNVQVAH